MPRSDVGCAIPDPTLQSALMASPAEARLPLSPFRQHRVPPAPTPRPPPHTHFWLLQTRVGWGRRLATPCKPACWLRFRLCLDQDTGAPGPSVSFR